MSDGNTVLEDLVCGMSVDSDEISADYQGDHYAFCSEQCRERFQANPQLYTDRECNAPELEEADFYKYRTLKLAEILPVGVADILTGHIRKMMGIQYIEVYDDEIEISFDPSQLTESQLEAAIARAGEGMGEEWATVLDHVTVLASDAREPAISHT